MFLLLYNILSLFLLIPVLLYHLYRSVSRGRAPAFAERFGCIPHAELDKIANRQVIWLHAVSVGESLAARPLLKALRSTYPNHSILFSTTTETGRGVAQSFPEPDVIIYFPFDFLPAVRSTMDAISPHLVIIMETEIWPNFCNEAARRKIPLILANGRISDRSFPRYQQFNWFFRQALRQFTHLCMQTDVDRERIIAIGAPEERTHATGNLKYDIPFRNVTLAEKLQIRQQYLLPEDLTILTAGSTHAGEEDYILDCFQTLREQHHNLFLIIAPRHPERTGEVTALFEKRGLPYRLRSALSQVGISAFSGGETLLLDTIGELMNIYALSDIVFVGGSLVATGGHNLLEPASVGVPCIFGPHMTNFREIAALVLQHQAGIQINNPVEFNSICKKLIDDTYLRHKLGQNGLQMMQTCGGATERYMNMIATCL